MRTENENEIERGRKVKKVMNEHLNWRLNNDARD